MIQLRVPATSANLGPGFDTLGLALNLYLTVNASLAERDIFLYEGLTEDAGQLPDTPDNLIHEGFRAAFAEVGEAAPALRLEVRNPIALARGLGSSSAALIAGIAAADALMEGRLGRDGVFQLGARLESHPDNVAPAVYGGFTVSAQLKDRYLCESLSVPADWQLLFGIPDFILPTHKARAALPETYSRDEAIFNASRTALWSLAVLGDRPDLLRVASQDALHEPYREPLVPGLARCRLDVVAAGAHAAFLSGAGPTVGVICSAERKAACAQVLQDFVGEGRVLEARVGGGYEVESVSSRR